MNVLFIHQNFPGQFKHLAPALAACGHRVVALGVRRLQMALPGVRYFRHQPRPLDGAVTSKTPAELHDLYSKVVRGESVARALRELAKGGFVPDVVYAHPGWGEALYVKDVFPGARLLIYTEYFYGTPGGDIGFDPEFSVTTPLLLQATRIKNTHLLHALSACDGALSPTFFQRSQHPAWSQERIDVVHDGIDTDRFRPDPNASVQLGSSGLTLTPGDEVVTFVARQLEPYRGYHILMRALPLLMKLRPNARVVIVGGDGVAYGAAPPPGTSWKKIFLAEVASGVDMQRLHFVGKLPHEILTGLMQVSAVHVYLTYPFVVSWSLLEAMSMGALVVASNTEPVKELVQHGHNGLLTDFFDPDALAQTVADALGQGSKQKSLRMAARQTIVESYDLSRRCLPRQIEFVTG